MKILRIDLDEMEEKKPVKSAKSRKAYARNPRKTFDDPVFKASEVTFYPPSYDCMHSIISVKKENGKILQEGYIEAIRYLTIDGKELVEFTCSPTSNVMLAAPFSVLVESECIKKLTQKRTVKQKTSV